MHELLDQITLECVSCFWTAMESQKVRKRGKGNSESVACSTECRQDQGERQFTSAYITSRLWILKNSLTRVCLFISEFSPIYFCKFWNTSRFKRSLQNMLIYLFINFASSNSILVLPSVYPHVLSSEQQLINYWWGLASRGSQVIAKCILY